MDDFTIKNNLINPDSIPEELRQMIKDLPLWVQEFFGFQTLLLFIYDEEEKQANKKNIRLLQNISEYRQKYINSQHKKQ